MYSEDTLMIPEHTALYMSGAKYDGTPRTEKKDLTLKVEVTITRR
jgi:hypothetical protein